MGAVALRLRSVGVELARDDLLGRFLVAMVDGEIAAGEGPEDAARRLVPGSCSRLAQEKSQRAGDGEEEAGSEGLTPEQRHGTGGSGHGMLVVRREITPGFSPRLESGSFRQRSGRKWVVLRR